MDKRPDHLSPTSEGARAAFAALWLLLRKDLRVELRAKDTLFTLALFSAVLAFLFAFSLVGRWSFAFAVLGLRLGFLAVALLGASW